jgi:hypothetical protein
LDDVALRAGVGVRIVTAELKSARWQREQELDQERRSRRLAERTDPRPQILNPDIDAPWLPTAQTLDSVLGASPAAKPPTRNIDSVVAQARKLAIPNTHAFTNSNAAEEE